MSSDDLSIKKVQGCNVATGCQTVTAVKSVAPDVAKVGATVKYTITLKNDMNYMIEDIIIRDSLPDGLNLVAGSIKVDGIAESGDLESGIQITQLQAKNKTIITFEAIIVDGDTNPKINIAEVTYAALVGRVPVDGKVTSNPAVLNVVGTILEKTITPNTALVGDILTCTITVTALADSTQNIIKDNLPPELELVDNKVSVGGTTITGDITQGIDIGPIAKGQTKTVTFKVKVIS